MNSLLMMLAAAAQPPAAPPPAVVTSIVVMPDRPDPARLAIATKVVAALVPDGIYARMMRDQMPKLIDGMMAQMGGMTASDIGLPDDKHAGETLDQAAMKADPAFRERMSISTRVMFEEMGNVFGKLEPRLRAGLSRAFARKYTVAQLTDMTTFFATPTGRTFAADYLATFADPEVMQEMTGALPELMKALPDIMKKVEAATAHLPPPPKPKAATP